jgi:hypothetical protein
MKINPNSINKLINELKPLGIEFDEFDTPLDNVKFTYKGETIKMGYWFFYRRGGMCKTLKYKNEKEVEWIDITDDVFYSLVKKIILSSFNLLT